MAEFRWKDRGVARPFFAVIPQVMRGIAPVSQTGGEGGLDLGRLGDQRQNQNRARGKQLSEPADHIPIRRVGQFDVRHDDVGCDVEASGGGETRHLGHDGKIGLLVDQGAQSLSDHGPMVYEHHVDRLV